MIKLFFSILSLFNLSPKLYDVVIKDIDKSNIVYSSDSFTLIEEESLNLYKDNLLVYSFEKESVISWTNYNYNLYVSCLKNKKLNIYIFDTNYRLIRTKEIKNRYNNVVLKNINDNLILLGEVSYYEEEIFKDNKKEYFDNADAFIAKLDNNLEFKDVRIYGGFLSEGFIDIKYDNNFYYLVLRKDSLSGGDFGNTYSNDKTYLLCKLDLDFNLAGFVSFKEKYTDFYIYSDFIYFMSSSTIYQLNFNLNLIFSRKISEECIFSYFAPNYSLVLINGLEGQIYDLKKMTETKFAISKVPINVVVHDESFIINYSDKSIKVNIYDLSNFRLNTKYLEEVGSLNNLFRDIDLISKDYNISFNPLVHGDYEVIYHFEEYDIKGLVTVLKECNVSNDIIYPIGYKLKFTGNAYLDKDLINNNHQLASPGLHELKLINNVGEAEIINFYVDDQIKFYEPSSKESDLEVYPNQKFEFIIALDNPLDYEIKSILVNDKKNYDFEVKDDKIILSFMEVSSGIYEYLITNLEFTDENIDFTLDCNYKYTVTVLDNSLKLDSSFSNTSSQIIYHSIVSDTNSTIRGFKIILTSGNEELYYNYAIKDDDIDLKYINMADSNLRINLVTYEGGNCFNEVELFSLKIDSGSNIINLGSIDIVSSGESLEEFRLIINKDKVLEVISKEKSVYIIKPDDSLKFIMIASLIGICSFICIFIYRKKKA